MKYKRHIATGALAFSLLISGTNVFAASPQDLGIKNAQHSVQKQNRSIKNLKINHKRRNSVGTISAINNNGFILEVKNGKTKTLLSLDVKTDAGTTYTKNGVSTTATDLSAGQKVIVVGTLDKTTNIVTAKKVKIVTVKN